MKYLLQGKMIRQIPSRSFFMCNRCEPKELFEYDDKILYENHMATHGIFLFGIYGSTRKMKTILVGLVNIPKWLFG